jgi:hypothetical protein
MSLTFAAISEMKKMLQNLEAWVDKSVVFAQTKKVEPNVLLSQRLAPDQYPLVRQIQSACDSAKFAAARLSGKEAPKHPDTETTVDEIRTRLKAVIAYLGTFEEADFKASETRIVPLTFMEGKGQLGKDYLVELAFPNFLFHVTHAYAILRHNGVELGKQDYIGSMTLRDL